MDIARSSPMCKKVPVGGAFRNYKNSMSHEKIQAIRQLIESAKIEEKANGYLDGILAEQITLLHGAIQLPKGDGLNTLRKFVESYIEHVPDFIEAIVAMTHEAGIEIYSQPFVDIACDYFLDPPKVIEGHRGMVALMDEAYLAQRLIEEINDRFIGRCGIPLAPMDMTRANLIIHHLIGEEFANQLDMAVQFSVEMLMNSEQVFDNRPFKDYVEDHRLRGWSEELERWPCLAEDLSIHLRFGF